MPFKTPRRVRLSQTLREQEGVLAQFMRVIIMRMFVPTVYGARQSHRSKSCSVVYIVKDLRYRGFSTPLSVPLFFEAVRVQYSVRPACGARRGAGQAILGLHDAYDRAGSTAEASIRLRWPLPLRTEQLHARIIQFSDAARREYCRGPFHTVLFGSSPDSSAMRQAAGATSVRLAALLAACANGMRRSRRILSSSGLS
ncbi:hypothetical protein B0H11DRAFT_2382331 [Mycena galericulata]|nr:hypothetical protein B0H11DRAFT_2382331 [Mycena galericulata]